MVELAKGSTRVLLPPSPRGNGPGPRGRMSCMTGRAPDTRCRDWPLMSEGLTSSRSGFGATGRVGFNSIGHGNTSPTKWTWHASEQPPLGQQIQHIQRSSTTRALAQRVERKASHVGDQRPRPLGVRKNPGGAPALGARSGGAGLAFESGTVRNACTVRGSRMKVFSLSSQPVQPLAGRLLDGLHPPRQACGGGAWQSPSLARWTGRYRGRRGWLAVIRWTHVWNVSVCWRGFPPSVKNSWASVLAWSTNSCAGGDWSFVPRPQRFVPEAHAPPKWAAVIHGARQGEKQKTILRFF